MKTIKLFLAATFLLSACGCINYIPTLRSYRKSSIGEPISHRKALLSREGSLASSIGWKERTYKLDNGNWVYVEPWGGRNCLIHWEVNPEGIIVGSRVEGSGCDIWPFR